MRKLVFIPLMILLLTGKIFSQGSLFFVGSALGVVSHSVQQPLIDFNKFFVFENFRILMGEKFEEYLPGAFMVVENKYTDNGTYGKQPVGVHFSFDTLQLGVNIADAATSNSQGVNFTLGINVNFDAFDIGVNYKQKNNSLGIFYSYGNKDKLLYLGIGYTFNGNNVRLPTGSQSTLVERSPQSFSHIFSASGIFKSQFTIGYDMEISVVNTLIPFYAGFLLESYLSDYFFLNFKGTFSTILFQNNVYYSPWEFSLNPQIKFTLENHCISGGVSLNIYEGWENSDGYSSYDVKIRMPIVWKYQY